MATAGLVSQVQLIEQVPERARGRQALAGGLTTSWVRDVVMAIIEPGADPATRGAVNCSALRSLPTLGRRR